MNATQDYAGEQWRKQWMSASAFCQIGCQLFQRPRQLIGRGHQMAEILVLKTHFAGSKLAARAVTLCGGRNARMQ